MEQKRAGCFTILVGAILLGAVLDRCSGKHPSESAPAVSTPAVPAQTPPERLSEMKAERQTKADLLMLSFGAEEKIRRDLAIVRDPDLRRLNPFPGPNDEQELLASLDKIVKDNAKSKGELDALDVEIAKEEASAAPSKPYEVASPAIPHRVLSPAEAAQRQRGLDIIENITDLLNAPSFATRAEVYCRFYVDQAPSLPILGAHSEKDVEQIYAELTRSEPSTREGELRRQYQLRAVQERMAAFEQNVNVCKGMVTTGALRIPEPNELRQKLAETQEHMAEFEGSIASPEPLNGDQKTISESLATSQTQDATPSPVPQPPGTIPPAPPVVAGKPTSGVLCNGTVEVQHNGELMFKNLPNGRLTFTFDHDAWSPSIRRESDGTQTLTMRSIKPGIQTKCDMRWEIVQ